MKEIIQNQRILKKGEKGITLISLIIVIIVLIILAAVSIKGVMGDKRNSNTNGNSSPRL